jgi:RecA/RadA recombinase
MRSSQALALEAILEKGLAKKPGGLLTGLGARISVASDLRPRGEPRERLATGLDPLDRLLPGGLPRGKLVELSGRRSSGRFSIGLAALASVTSTGEPAALVDLGEHLDPQGAAASGVDLELLLWARPRRVKEALAAAEMLLAAGFPLVVADFGLSARGARFVPDAAWIRLARAVEAQGSSLLLLTPYRMSGIAPDAVLTADASHPLWQGTGRTPRLLTGLSSRLTLQKNARVTPGKAEELRLSIFPPLPAGEDQGEGKTAATPVSCHPEERVSSSCHPEERSDEGSAPVPSITNHKSQITNLHQSPITNHQSSIVTLSP